MAVSASAYAQEAQDPQPDEDAMVVDLVDLPPTSAPVQVAPIAPPLTIQLVDPTDDDVEVPLATTRLLVRGVTRPAAVVSLGGELADVDAQGNFSGLVALDEGANAIDVIASASDGTSVSTTLYVVRGN
jgi:hypothetical protein